MSAFGYDPAVYEGANASLTSVVLAVRFCEGQVLSVENTDDTSVRGFWAYLAADIGEFLSMSHCRAWLQSVFPKISDVLLTNRHQPLLEMTKDTSPSVHDTIMSCCDWPRYQLLGCTNYHDNCADNLHMVLATIGPSAPQVPDPFNLWMNIPIALDCLAPFEPSVLPAGDRSDMRAPADCISNMSACTKDENPINGHYAMPFESHFSIGE